MTKLRYFFLVLACFYMSYNVYGQKPVIASAEPKSSSMGTEVIILGTGFDTNIANIVVHFGGANAEIIEARDNLISVRVPPGTVYRTISVTNLVSGLTGYSDKPHLLSYSGGAFDGALFDTPSDFASESELYDLSLDDFDGDGKLDIASANNNSNLINVYKNTSTVGALSFTTQFITISSKTINVNTRDLNGDGKPEIIVSKSGNPGDRVYYMKNTSTPGTISFNSPQSLLVDGNIARRIEIEDLDKDGLPEIIVTNQANNRISIFNNTSSGGNISFAPIVTVEVIDPNTPSLHSAGLAVSDLNGDGFPEIVTTRFLENDLYITPNTSQVGSLGFGATQVVAMSGNISFVAAGDINQDGKNDLLVSKLQQNQVAILINNGTGDAISFATEQPFTVNDRPWGLSLGDLNGDGLTDVAVASINNTVKQVSVLENTSTTAGGFSMTVKNVGTPEITRNLKVGDIDADGKPDIVVTSLGNPYNVTVLRNKNCFVPKMTPDETQDLCLNAEVTLRATANAGATYTWKRSDNTVLGTGTDPFYTFTAAIGTFGYFVEASTEAGACVVASNSTTINVSNGIIPNPPLILDPAPTCEGNNVILEVDPATLITGATYTWEHPDGTTNTGTSLALNNVTIGDAGRYLLSAFDGGCESSLDSAFLEVIATPQIAIVSDDNFEFCSGQSANLKVTNDPYYSYKWFLDGNEISGATNFSYSATASGDYTTEVTTPGNCSVVSDPATIISATHPVASYTSPNIGCVGSTLTFTNTSTVHSGINVIYTWNFGDGTQSTDLSPTHTYATAADYSVSLTVSYDDASCANSTVPSTITISDPPTLTIDADVTEFCAGGVANLSITGTYASVLWSTGESTNSIEVNEGGNYNVTITTDAACESTANIDITEFSLPSIVITPADPSIEEGETIQLVASGAETYVWSPSLGLDDSTIPNPIANPTETTDYMITGTDINLCIGTTVVTVTVNEPVSEIVPQLMFSPNGDGVNDLWVIENIEDCIDCTLTIYDRSGIKVFEEVNYSQSWDGIYNGSSLDDEVYYFVVTDGSNKVKSGSITLIR